MDVVEFAEKVIGIELLEYQKVILREVADQVFKTELKAWSLYAEDRKE